MSKTTALRAPGIPEEAVPLSPEELAAQCDYPGQFIAGYAMPGGKLLLVWPSGEKLGPFAREYRLPLAVAEILTPRAHPRAQAELSSQPGGAT